MFQETKPFYKTSEFWASVAAVLTVLAGLEIHDRVKAYVVGGVTIAYAISRGLAKQGQPYDPVNPADVTPAQAESLDRQAVGS